MAALLNDWRGRLALLTLVALALRGWDFGNPVIHVDEQYYLLVGDRMLKGDLPYLDIWDRKPIGLFLLYAAIRLLPGDGVLAYQLVATGFAVATAMMVEGAARRTGARPSGALAAAIAYLIWLPLLGGRGGQSPVFYNLFVTGAAMLTLRLPALAMAARHGAIIASGTAACLLAGIAIQMKYTPAFEGAFIGLAHGWMLWRSGAGPARTAAAMLLWLAAGLAPSLAAWGWYAALGEQAARAFWFANVTSIFLRPGYPLNQIFMRLLGITAQLSPLIVAAALAWRWRAHSGAAALGAGLAAAWLASALVGFFIIGTFFDHYALPLIAPLAVMGAVALGRSPRVGIGALALALTLFVVETLVRRDDAAGARKVAAVVKANSRDGCPWVAIGDTITYRLADACLPTAYAFPNLLIYATEQGATGIDEAAEVARILRTRPPVIVTSDRKLAIWNQRSLALVKTALARDYRLIFTTPRSNWHTAVYLRRDLRSIDPEPAGMPDR